MRTQLWIVIVLGCVAGVVHGDDPEQAIRQLESQISVAIVARDADFVERVWDEDFTYTGVRGEQKNKREIVAELKTGDLHFESMKFDDQRIRIFSDTAVVTGRATTKGISKQGPISGEFRYTRVYVKRGDQWRLIAFQGTPIVVGK